MIIVTQNVSHVDQCQITYIKLVKNWHEYISSPVKLINFTSKWHTAFNL